mmetsp:Transcript_40982/g.47174  ORF Transcript_40982/g.47174 Transcript_40982/m.47174 type:complete len:105 (-) Transcript_40982:112-426(-)
MGGLPTAEIFPVLTSLKIIFFRDTTLVNLDCLTFATLSPKKAMGDLTTFLLTIVRTILADSTSGMRVKAKSTSARQHSSELRFARIWHTDIYFVKRMCVVDYTK